MKKNKEYTSIHLLKVSPDILSRVEFNNNIGNLREGMVNLQKEDSSKRRFLKVTAPVTHAAKLINNRVYQPRRMVQDIKSFVSPYAKPILLDHNDSKDPIGRVISSTYEPIDHSFIEGNPEAFDEADTFKLLQFLMKTGVIYNDNFTGVGQAVLSTRITDQDAIEKFLDERYLTFSVRVASNQILDPHTGLPFRPFFEEDEDPEVEYSPHERGEIVNGMFTFPVLDEMHYRELSVVNIPGDELGIVREMEEMLFGDSKNNKNEIIHTDGSCKINLISQTGDVTNMKINDNQNDNKDSRQPENEVLDTQENLLEITDSSSASEIYLELSKFLEEMSDSSEMKILSEDELKQLPGSSFAGPSRSFPIIDSFHAEASKKLLGSSKISESQKQKILSCIKRKEKQFVTESKDAFNVEEFSSYVDSLSDFDFEPFFNLVLNNCVNRGIDTSDSELLATFVNSNQSKVDNTIAEGKIAELESSKKAAEEHIDSLTEELKNYTSISSVLLKVFKDNMSIVSLEDAIATEKLEELNNLKENTQLLLKDEALIEKVKSYLGGFSKEENNDKDDTQVEDPTVGVQDAKLNNNDTLIEKQVRVQFESIKMQDGLDAAIEYLDKMCLLQYVSKDFTQDLVSLNSNKDN